MWDGNLRNHLQPGSYRVQRLVYIPSPRPSGIKAATGDANSPDRRQRPSRRRPALVPSLEARQPCSQHQRRTWTPRLNSFFSHHGQHLRTDCRRAGSHSGGSAASLLSSGHGHVTLDAGCSHGHIGRGDDEHQLHVDAGCLSCGGCIGAHLISHRPCAIVLDIFDHKHTHTLSWDIDAPFRALLARTPHKTPTAL